MGIHPFGRLVGALLVAPLLATAAPPVVIIPHTPYPQGLPIATDCWFEPHYFDSLRTGPIDYCRQNLRFRPGALECLTFSDRVCTVWFPDRREWGETRSATDERLIRCPAGPQPPTCPRLRPPGSLGSGRR